MYTKTVNLKRWIEQEKFDRCATFLKKMTSRISKREDCNIYRILEILSLTAPYRERFQKTWDRFRQVCRVYLGTVGLNPERFLGEIRNTAGLS